MPKTATAQSSRDPSVTVTATVGHLIGFKSDVEQCAKVKEIGERKGFPYYVTIRVDVSEGEYAGKNQWLDLRDCWNIP